MFPFNVATEVACAGTLGRGQHTPAASETPPATPQCHCQCVRHDVVQQRGLQRTNEILLRRFLVRGREARVLAAGLPARGSSYFCVLVSPAWKDGWRRGLAVERGRASCPRGGVERHRAPRRDHHRQGSRERAHRRGILLKLVKINIARARARAREISPLSFFFNFFFHKCTNSI